MNFYLYSPVYFEKWDWRNSVEKGIGGSETSHVEMAWRLAARGHNVVNYVPLPEDSPGEWKGTKWYDISQVDWTQKGIWIIYRDPTAIENFPKIGERINQTIWLLMQDWDYPNWTNKRIKGFDSIIAMCKWHARNLVSRYPAARNHLWLNSNGIKIDLIEQIEKEQIQRDPKLIIYTSSPDRGLKPLLLSFKKAREYVSDLRLKITYGFDNIDKLIEKNPNSYMKGLKNEILELADQPGVEWLGRVNQPDLYRLWFSAGIWVYQTNFAETSCISCMEAQAMGAIPIFSPIYAQGENIGYGIDIPGNCDDALTNARFAAEIVRLALNPELQEMVRTEMMPWARNRYDWEKMVDLWEAKALGKTFLHEYPEEMKEEDYYGW